MNAQLKGSFLISLSKDCLYSSGATLILIFVLKLRKQSQWAVQKVVALKGETFQWRIFCLEGGWGGFSYHHVAFLLVVLNKNVIVFSLSLPTFGFTLQCIMPST